VRYELLFQDSFKQTAVRLIEGVRAILRGPASDPWPMPERIRQPLKTGFRLVGIVMAASVVSFTVVSFIPLSLDSKAILFCILGFAIYLPLAVFTSTSK
jgi:hypothetical protein